jgi:hypothetical protein
MTMRVVPIRLAAAAALGAAACLAPLPRQQRRRR